MSLHAIEQTQLRRQHRVDGVGRPTFDVHTGDDPEDRQARKYVGSALKPAKKAALERLVEQLQRDNDRLQASLQLAYERAEAAKQEWEAVRSRRPVVWRCLHAIVAARRRARELNVQRCPCPTGLLRVVFSR